MSLPDWGERTMSIRPEDETILETDMTSPIICGMCMENDGFELSESVRVSPTGVETLTSYRTRKEAMVESIARHLGGRVSATDPQGGFFRWVTSHDEFAQIDTWSYVRSPSPTASR